MKGLAPVGAEDVARDQALLTERVDDLLDWSAAAEHARALEAVMSPDGFRSAGAPIPLAPVLLHEFRYREIVRTGRHAMRLLRKVVLARSADPRELARLVDFRFPPVSLWSDSPVQNRWAWAMARPDIGLVDGVPQVFEVNINSAIGGLTQVPRLDATFLRRADLRAAWREQPVSGSSVTSALARALRTVGRAVDRDRPHVGIVGFPHDEDHGGLEPAFVDLIDDLCRHGVPAVYVQPQDVRCRNGRAYAGRTRLDVLVRMFVTADAPAAGIDIGPLQDVVAKDAAVLLSPESAGVVASKRVLAWVTEAADRMPAADAAFVRRHIPETHVVEAPGTLGSTRQEVRERLRRDQQDLVLKGNQGHSAESVTVGRECTEGEWSARVDDALASRACVVQRRIENDVLGVPVYSEVEDRAERLLTRAVYGPLLLDGRCGGILVRHSAAARGDVVSAITGGFANTAFRWSSPG